MSLNLRKKIKIQEEACKDKKSDIGKENILIHPPDKLVDEVLTVSGITSFNVVISLLLEATEWCLELERPQEVVGLLEMRSHCQNLVDQILSAYDPMLAKSLFCH